MARSYKLRSVAAAMLAMAPSLLADREYSQRIWRMEDGLPSGRVQAISQTADGYLWVGTSGGLVRFDGLRFVVFDRSNTREFADDSVLSLFATKNGSLWIGTEGGGLVHYQNRKFVSYSSRHGLTNLFVRSVYEDDSGKVWAGTDRGIFLGEGGRFTRLDGTAEIPYVSGSHIYADRSGHVFVAGNGLYEVVNGGLVRRNAQRGIRAILERPGQSHWLAASSGLFALHGDKAHRIHSNISAPSRLMNDPEGNTWIGTERGLFLARDNRVTPFHSPEALPDNSVLSLYCDRENNIWVGSRDGLTRLSRKVVSTAATGAGTDTDSATFTVYRDPADRMWLVSGDGNLYGIENARLTRRMVPGLSAGVNIRTVFEDRRGCLWIGTANQGFFRTQCGPVKVYNMAAGLRNNGVRAFLEDREGTLWVATGSGLARLESERLKVYYTDEGLAYGSVRSLLEDKRNGDLWVGTDGGLSRIRQGKFHSDKIIQALAGERIWALHQDANGAIWVGTRGRGLFRIQSDRLSEIGSEAGLPNSIHQILEDKAGNLWMSGPSGVVRARRTDLDAAADGAMEWLKVVSYGTAEGIKSVHMSGGIQPAGAISPAGEVWFPSVKGAVAIRTDTLPSIHAPSAFLEDVLVDGQPAEFHKGVRIPAGTNRLELQFTAPNLLSPERIAFWYKLEGFDRDWTYTSTRRVASYTSLPPGDYRFRLIARNLAAPDQPSEASVSLTWRPHFSQTWLAWGAGILSLAGMVWLSFGIYTRQTKQRYSLLLAERARLAREMHDTVIQGCVGVSTLLEAASSFEQTNTSKLIELMNRARGQVRITLEEARQAVWDLRHDYIGGELLDSLPAFAKQLSQQSGVSIGVEVVGDPIRLKPEVDRNLFAATREAVRNAVAHGKPKQVRVVLCYLPEQMRIEVIDDGIGFEAGSPRIAAGHYGLLGMRERMEHLGGSLRLFSQHTQGTHVIAELPLGGGRL